MKSRWLPLIVVLFLTSLTNPARALTPEEVTQLKQAGVSDETIQLMIKSEMEGKKWDDTGPNIRETESSITYSTGRAQGNTLREQEIRNQERAWELLRNMRLHIYEPGEGPVVTP